MDPAKVLPEPVNTQPAYAAATKTLTREATQTVIAVRSVTLSGPAGTRGGADGAVDAIDTSTAMIRTPRCDFVKP